MDDSPLDQKVELQDTSAATIVQLTAQADATPAEKFSDVPVDIVEIRSKLGALVGNADQAKVFKAQNRAYQLGLKQPYFIKELLIELEGAGDRPFQFVWKGWASGTQMKRSAVASANALKVSISDVVTQIEITPPSKLMGLGTVTIKSIKIVGVNQIEFAAKIDRLGSISDQRDALLAISAALKKDQKERLAQVAEFENQKSTLATAIQTLTESKQRQQSDIEALVDKSAQLEKGIAAALDRQSSIDIRAAAVDREVSEKQSAAKELSDQIAAKQSQLKSLEADINLFPSEIGGFAKAGGLATEKYMLLSFLPIALIAVLAFDLMSSARDLIHSGMRGWDLAETLLLRLPYVAVALSIIGASYKIAKVFVAEIIAISNQRLNLTKLSIIAKDVTDASAVDLSMPPERIYERRAFLKMSLLREHLKNELPQTYTYPVSESEGPDEQEK